MTRARVVAVTLLALLLVACEAPSTAATTAPVLAAAPSSCHAVAGKADRACTPGAPNPRVTQLNIGATICRKGWTATIRPPVSYTDQLKAKQMPLYGLTGLASAVEEDHLLPLEIGGNPTDPRNLWPEPWDGQEGAHAKDGEENSLHRAVCGGRMKLDDAQAKMLADWTHP